MEAANAAYYAGKDPFADFTTAPEISQMFGELIGAWIASVWTSIGAPAPFLLVEAGPGRGTLMQDAWRTLRRVAPACEAAARLHLIEFSARLRDAQAARLPHATWHGSMAQVPDGPMLMICNEFLDALPIRQFVCTAAGWNERFVENGRFVEQPADPAPDLRAEIGEVVETGQAACAWVSELAGRLVRQGGAALLIDYGTGQTRAGCSLQALRDGRPADPLADPGSADVTAHVDFAALGRAAEKAGATAWGPVTQGAFLEAIGLSVRTARLAAARPDEEGTIRAAATRLSAPDQMGALFKVLCIAHPGCPPPPGVVP